MDRREAHVAMRNLLTCMDDLHASLSAALAAEPLSAADRKKADIGLAAAAEKLADMRRSVVRTADA